MPTESPDQLFHAGAGMIPRRRFLGWAAAVVSAGWTRLRAAPEEARLRCSPGRDPARVCQVVASRVVDGPVVHRGVFREMLDAGMKRLTGRSDPADAWGAVLKPDDVIGLKFNRSGQWMIGTSDAVADVLIESLVSAGWTPEQIVCIEAPDGVAERHGTKRPTPGFAARPTDFGSGSDSLARVLDDVTALINIPFIKDHNIAGLTCGLKNLSHGLVKHPARYHGTGCSPYIADIVALPQIGGKLRLTLVDGLRVVFAGGPEVASNTLSDNGLILLSQDPVAADAVALDILNGVRKRYGLGEIAAAADRIVYLAAAHRRGLGIAMAPGIELVRAVL